jgi:hypothetical protein
MGAQQLQSTHKRHLAIDPRVLTRRQLWSNGPGRSSLILRSDKFLRQYDVRTRNENGENL